MPLNILNIIISKAKEFGIKKLYLFGSAAETENFRDIDLACEGLKGLNLLLFAGEIENEILMNVDVIDIEEDNPFNRVIRPKLKLLYEQI